MQGSENTKADRLYLFLPSGLVPHLHKQRQVTSYYQKITSKCNLILFQKYLFTGTLTNSVNKENIRVF